MPEQLERMLELLESIDNNISQIVEQSVTRKKLTAKIRKDNYTEEFESWWELYPRKVGKPNAARAYHKAVAEVHRTGVHFKENLDSPDEYLLIRVLQFVQAWPDTRQKTDGKYIPHASTWLNNQYYLAPDEFSDSSYQGSGGPQWQPMPN